MLPPESGSPSCSPRRLLRLFRTTDTTRRTDAGNLLAAGLADAEAGFTDNPGTAAGRNSDRLVAGPVSSLAAPADCCGRRLAIGPAAHGARILSSATAWPEWLGRPTDRTSWPWFTTVHL